MERSTLRDLLAIPGALIAFWSILFLLYAYTLRIPAEGCLRGDLLVAGACWSGWVVLLLPLLAGIALLVVGLAVFRPEPQFMEDLLQTGGGTRVLLWVLVSLAVLPLLLAAVLLAVEAGGADTFLLERGGTYFAQTSLLGGVGTLGVLLLGVALPVHLGHRMRQGRFLAAAAQAAPAAEEGAGPPEEEPAGTDAPLPPEYAPQGVAAASPAAAAGGWTAAQAADAWDQTETAPSPAEPSAADAGAGAGTEDAARWPRDDSEE